MVDRQEYARAEALLQTLLAQNARDAEALYLLGFVQQRRNRPADSLRTYTAAAAVRTPTAEEVRLVALDYVLLDDYTDAGHWLERSIAIDPRNAESLYDLARVRMHDGRFTDATALLRRSLALREGSSKAWDNLGVCLEAQNDPDAAEQAYLKAVALAGDAGQGNAQAFIDFGTLLNTRNGYDRAVPLLERAVALAPSDAKAQSELGRAYQGMGKRAEALEAMERAVALDPANSRYHYQLGRLYRTLGKDGKAQQEFAKSASLYGGKSAE